MVHDRKTEALSGILVKYFPRSHPISTNVVGMGVGAFLLLLLSVGALGAGFFLADASEAVLAVVLSFGAAALIYLIAEELLVENVQAEESIFSTITLFTGFLALLLLKLLESG